MVDDSDSKTTQQSRRNSKNVKHNTEFDKTFGQTKRQSSDIFLNLKDMSSAAIQKEINTLTKHMKKYAENLDFEQAVILRDRIKELEQFFIQKL